MKRTARITRDNMIENMFRLQRELDADTLTEGEAKRLLGEALHILHRQQTVLRCVRTQLEALSAPGRISLAYTR